MSRPKQKCCGKCGTTQNLTTRGNICKDCRAARDKAYNEKRMQGGITPRKNAKLASHPFYVPAQIGPCGRDFDPEVCPKRQKLAIKRARAKKKIDNICCLGCTIKIQEAQQ